MKTLQLSRAWLHRRIQSKVLWLKLTKSINDPRTIGDFFLNAILERDRCPTLIKTDRDAENGIMATVQCFLRRNGTDSQSGINAHRYGSSHSNQRIEAWWAYLRRSWSSCWIDFFKDMVDGDILTCQLRVDSCQLRVVS